jgi:two-component system response regulator PilR (NtrC family)
MTTTSALIIDDEPDIRELLEITLSRMGLETNSAANIAQAHKLLASQHYDVCLTDMKLPDGNGIELVKYIQSNHRELPVAVFTAHGNMDLAIEAMKAGAFDFISKPVELEQLRGLVNTALKLKSSESSVPADSAPKPPALLGDAAAMVKLRKQIAKVARSQAPVFISGESGTGKELAARAIHYQGARAEAPFIPVNCGAIPRELMESEFFGHKKGSFTGATSDKQGLFMAANGGTLFLDEVADLPLEMQVKLLRAIQEKAVRPVGSEQETSIDVRILSATHKDLTQEIDQERFRKDLFYRINVIQIDMPPLRDRVDDIPMLAETFLQRFAHEIALPAPTLSKQAVKALQDYSFPGNVRELENILERTFTLCDDDEIQLDDLQLSRSAGDPGIVPKDSKVAEDVDSLDDYLEDIEREVIVAALEKTKWNRTAAAKKLGVTFRSLRYRLKKLGLDED